jgi:hypothetical protein
MPSGVLNRSLKMTMQTDGSLRLGLPVILAVDPRRVEFCRGAVVVLAATMALTFTAIAGAASVNPPVIAGPHAAAPNDANGYYVRCSAEIERGRVTSADDIGWGDHGVSVIIALGRAIDDCSDAIRLKPDFAEAYRNRGLARAMKGELERAIKDYGEALRLRPQDALAFDSRGLAWQLKGWLAHAVDDFAQARRIERRNTTFKQHLDTARDAQAALAPGSGPYITGSGLGDTFHQVEYAIVPPMDLDDLFDAARGKLSARLPRKRQIWNEVGPFINASGMSAVTAIVNAIHESRIVGIGEQHTFETNLNILMALNHMEDFARAGLTDLFIEMPSSAQPIFDKFNNGTETELEIPDDPEQIVRPGVDRDVAEGTLRLLRTIRYASGRHYYQLWKAAKAAGIRLHAIDNASGGLVFILGDEGRNTDLNLAKLINERDQDMMTAMLHALDAPAGGLRARKGMAWLGLAHLPDAKAEATDKSAFELLRANGQRVTTFFTQVAANEKSATLTPFVFARYVNSVVAVPTHATGRMRNPLSAFNAFLVPNEGYNYRLDDWDFVILYPHHCVLVANGDKGGHLAC